MVSTVGLLTGIATAQIPRGTIFITGAVLILVEALSMAAGSFLSESSAEDFLKRREVAHEKSLSGSLIMFFSYLVAGFIPLFPYLLLEVYLAAYLSIICSLLALIGLGVVSAKISGVRVLSHSVRMVVIGGLAIAAGIAVGNLLGDLRIQ